MRKLQKEIKVLFITKRVSVKKGLYEIFRFWSICAAILQLLGEEFPKFFNGPYCSFGVCSVGYYSCQPKFIT